MLYLGKFGWRFEEALELPDDVRLGLVINAAQLESGKTFNWETMSFPDDPTPVDDLGTSF